MGVSSRSSVSRSASSHGGSESPWPSDSRGLVDEEARAVGRDLDQDAVGHPEVDRPEVLPVLHLGRAQAYFGHVRNKLSLTASGRNLYSWAGRVRPIRNLGGSRAWHHPSTGISITWSITSTRTGTRRRCARDQYVGSIASPSTVHAHLANLERAGLRRDPDEATRTQARRREARGGKVPAHAAGVCVTSAGCPGRRDRRTGRRCLAEDVRGISSLCRLDKGDFPSA